MPTPPRNLTHDGTTLPLTAWAERTGVPASTIRARLDAGWPVGKALTTPPDKRFRKGGRPRLDDTRPCPRLREHSTGQAFVRWSAFGKRYDQYFGPAGTPEASEGYRRFQAEWAAGVYSAGLPASAGSFLSVAGIIDRWLAHCETTYTKRGKITSEVHCNRSAMRVLNDLYGDLPATEFGPKKLKTIREAMVKEGWVRTTVNTQTARIVRCFGWAVSEELIPPAVADALKAVTPLVAGRTEAPESEPRKPVPKDHLGAILPHLHPRVDRRAVLGAMVRVQELTGMRPGELCSLRAEDLDRSRPEWLYEVTEYNKMLHKDVKRRVWIGPKAKEILAPFLADAKPGERLFRLPPARSGAGWSDITVRRYRDYIADACAAAGVPVWTPHQVRHRRATDVMERYEDDEMVGAAIGDSAEVARQVYAQNPGDAVARRIARELG